MDAGAEFSGGCSHGAVTQQLYDQGPGKGRSFLGGKKKVAYSLIWTQFPVLDSMVLISCSLLWFPISKMGMEVIPSFWPTLRIVGS